MKNISKSQTFLVLAAFVAVFVFGCIASASDRAMDQGVVSVAATHEQSSHSQENDHMSVSLDLPVSGQVALPFAVVLFVIGIFFVLWRYESGFLEGAVRSRLRFQSRRELWTQWSTLILLFRVGILNPKSY